MFVCSDMSTRFKFNDRVICTKTPDTIFLKGQGGTIKYVGNVVGGDQTYNVVFDNDSREVQMFESELDFEDPE
jgi:hypothetical protein